MRILVVGAGGVGSAVAPIAARRDFFESIFERVSRPPTSRRSTLSASSLRSNACQPCRAGESARSILWTPWSDPSAAGNVNLESSVVAFPGWNHSVMPATERMC